MYLALMDLPSIALLSLRVEQTAKQWKRDRGRTAHVRRFLHGGSIVLLNDVTDDVSNQLQQQSELGVQITVKNDVPEIGPTNKGVWDQIPQVTAVFADLKGSTALNSDNQPRDAAYAYTYFIRAMTLILERFDAKYIDIQGDGIFGLFSGHDSIFLAATSAITMRTLSQRVVAEQFDEDTSVDWKLTAGVGIDHGTLLVRRLGLRGTKQNEVWAGKPVNVAAKLSSAAGPNEVVVSDRTFQQYQGASRIRQRALLWSCGCNGNMNGRGLDMPAGETSYLWEKETAPQHMGLDFETVFKLSSKWCSKHGPEFCETISKGKRPD